MHFLSPFEIALWRSSCFTWADSIAEFLVLIINFYCIYFSRSIYFYINMVIFITRYTLRRHTTTILIVEDPKISGIHININHYALFYLLYLKPWNSFELSIHHFSSLPILPAGLFFSLYSFRKHTHYLFLLSFFFVICFILPDIVSPYIATSEEGTS